VHPFVARHHWAHYLGLYDPVQDVASFATLSIMSSQSVGSARWGLLQVVGVGTVGTAGLAIGWLPPRSIPCVGCDTRVSLVQLTLSGPLLPWYGLDRLTTRSLWFFPVSVALGPVTERDALKGTRRVLCRGFLRPDGLVLDQEDGRCLEKIPTST